MGMKLLPETSLVRAMFCLFSFLPLFSGQSSTDLVGCRPEDWVENSTTGIATFLVNASGHIAAVFVCWISLVFCNLLVYVVSSAKIVQGSKMLQDSVLEITFEQMRNSL